MRRLFRDLKTLSTSVPLKVIVPFVGVSKFTTHLARVDFPLPDSPTSPNVSPRLTVRETLSNAWMTPVWRFNSKPLSKIG